MLSYKLGIEYDPNLEKKDPSIRMSLPQHNENHCLICYEEMSKSGLNQVYSLSCKHTFCKNCWMGYVTEKVESGCLGIDANCMQAGCNLRVGHSVFLDLLSSQPKKKEQYWKWVCKQFTDDNKRIKWCPVNGCDYCFEKGIYATVSTVQCQCGGSFCFRCGMASHAPCNCELAM